MAEHGANHSRCELPDPHESLEPPQADIDAGLTSIRQNEQAVVTAETIYAGPGTLTWAWDLDSDGDFDDGNGQHLTITWAQLLSLGMTEPLVYGLRVRVSSSTGASSIGLTYLAVLRDGPLTYLTTVVISGPLRAQDRVTANGQPVSTTSFRWFTTLSPPNEGSASTTILRDGPWSPPQQRCLHHRAARAAGRRRLMRAFIRCLPVVAVIAQLLVLGGGCKDDKAELYPLWFLLLPPPPVADRLDLAGAFDAALAGPGEVTVTLNGQPATIDGAAWHYQTAMPATSAVFLMQLRVGTQILEQREITVRVEP
jgi:hypothetical protein